MTKRILSALLVCALLIACVPYVGQEAAAATQGIYAPYPLIEYGYSSTVKCGTIRYVSQVTSDSYFYSAYWPSSTFGNYTGASVECGTASISMALSYIGINKTANDILVAYNGSTVFSNGWGGSTYKSYSASSLATATDNYINGNGKYSPPVIHIPGYSTLGHYVVVIGRSGTTYQILDPWQRAVTSMTVSGSSATYSRNGYTTYDTIDQIHQWYNASASLDYASTCESYAAHCQIKADKSTPVNTQPCAVGNNDSTTIETASAGDTYTAIGLYRNGGGNLWYQVTSTSGETGYMYAGHVSYVDQIISDIALTGASYPNGLVAGNSYVISGTIKSSYNYLTDAALYVHSGFGTSGTKKIGYSDTVGGKSYALAYSNIDANTKFGSLTSGNYTYAIYASYQNYYASDATTLASNTGTVTLAAEYFVVIPSSVTQSSCSHSYTTTDVQAATCTEDGVQVKSCATCGLVSETTTAATGHSYGSWTTTAATCAAAGSRTRTCANCGDVQTETIAATGHDYDVSTSKSSCTEYEIYEFTCANCGDYYTLNAGEMTTTWLDQLPAGMDESLFNTKTQYRYSDYETTTSYDTSLDGYTQKSSEWVQSGTNTVNYVSSWPSGFSTSSSMYSTYNKKSSKVTASETETAKTVINSDAVVGYLYYHWCYSGSYYSVSASSGSYTTFHAFYSTTDPSSCSNYDSSDGSYYYPNSSCCSNSEWFWPATVYAQKSTSYKKLFTYERWTDYTDWSDTAVTASSTRNVETRTVYQLKEAELGEHSYGSKVTTAATCTTAGVRTYTCTACGDSYTESIAATGHSYDDGVVTTAPGCTTTGVRTYTCTACGDSYQKSIYATGHTYEAVVTPPTCTAEGYTTYTCTGCGTSYKDDTTPVGDHTYTATVTAPTCAAEGYTTYTCIGCGTSYKADITPTVSHTYSSKVTAPTCTESGCTTYTCQVCGHSYTDAIVSATGHSYKSVVTAPTCTANGYTTYTCTDCGYSYTGNTVAPIAHTYTSKVTAPTCTESGYTTYTCTVCSHSYTGNSVAATGHSYENGSCTVCGGADPDYIPTITAPTLTLSYPTLSFEDQIQYNVYFTVSDLTDVAEMGLITFDSKLADGTIADAVDVISGYTGSDGTYVAHTGGIPAKNLGDALYFKVYAKLTDGSYIYTSVAGYNAVAYAKTILSSSSTSMDAKRLMVAMLNYGAAAQEHFGYNTDNLINSFLTDPGRALVADYDESMVDDVVAADSAKAGHFVMQSGSFTSIFPTVSFEGAFSVNYYFKTGLTPDNGLTFAYWDADTYESVDKLTTANVTGMMKMTQDGDLWTAAVEGIAAKDMDKTIYVVAIYRSGGTAYTSKVIPYSIGKYCETIAAQGNEFGAATAVYGYYAKTYFANL